MGNKMPNYIKQDAAVNLASDLQIKKINGYEQYNQAILNYSAELLNLPAADVLPVETCGECAYAYPAGIEIKCTKHSGEKDKFGEACNYSEYHDRNWFCADWRKSRDD